MSEASQGRTPVAAEVTQSMEYASAIQQAASLCDAGRLAEAEQLCSSILLARRNDSYALHILGVCASRRGRFTEALDYLGRALDANVNFPEARLYQGNALAALNRFREAIDSYDRAIASRPGYAEAFCNRGNALQALRRYAEALADYDTAISINRAFAEAYCNRAAALHALNRHAEAIESCDTAISLRPDYAEAHCNRAYTLQALDRHQEAIESCDAAISLRPDYSNAKYVKACSLLCFGPSRAAWQFYEQRLGSRIYQRLQTFGLEALGETAPDGKKLLVQWEQRFGDVIQMLRYAPVLERTAGECWWQIHDPLRKLVARSFPDLQQVGVADCPPAVQYRVPFTSLPLALNTDGEEGIPKDVPYLVPDGSKVADWNRRIRPHTSGAPVVGLVWRANPEPQNRSVALEDMHPLFAIDRIKFATLQRDVTDAEAARLREHDHIIPVGDQLADFDETAALISAVDLVISVDTAVAHLAGALGKPTWVLLKSGADWRWLLEREDSPWYPTARLFRQQKLGDWVGSVERVASALAERF